MEPFSIEFPLSILVDKEWYIVPSHVEKFESLPKKRVDEIIEFCKSGTSPIHSIYLDWSSYHNGNIRVICLITNTPENISKNNFSDIGKMDCEDSNIIKKVPLEFIRNLSKEYWEQIIILLSSCECIMWESIIPGLRGNVNISGSLGHIVDEKMV